MKQTLNRMVKGLQQTESNVPLTEEVVSPPPRPFVPSLSEYASDGTNFTPIAKSGTGTGELYAVSPKETLFIVSGYVAGTETANVNTHGVVVLKVRGEGYNGAADLNIATCYVDHITGQHGGNDSMSFTFPMPLKVNFPATVRMEATGFTSPAVQAFFTGFTLPKKISIR